MFIGCLCLNMLCICFKFVYSSEVFDVKEYLYDDRTSISMCIAVKKFSDRRKIHNLVIEERHMLVECCVFFLGNIFSQHLLTLQAESVLNNVDVLADLIGADQR